MFHTPVDPFRRRETRGRALPMEGARYQPGEHADQRCRTCSEWCACSNAPNPFYKQAVVSRVKRADDLVTPASQQRIAAALAAYMAQEQAKSPRDVIWIGTLDQHHQTGSRRSVSCVIERVLSRYRGILRYVDGTVYRMERAPSFDYAFGDDLAGSWVDDFLACKDEPLQGHVGGPVRARFILVALFLIIDQPAIATRFEL